MDYIFIYLEYMDFIFIIYIYIWFLYKGFYYIYYLLYGFFILGVIGYINARPDAAWSLTPTIPMGYVVFSAVAGCRC